MKAPRTLLRILVLLGSFVCLSHPPLLVSTPKYSCVAYTYQQGNCSSGCTNVQWYTAVPNGQQGTYDLFPATQPPCGAAKPGQSCQQPTGVLQAENDPSCCGPPGDYCGNGYPCCMGLQCGNDAGTPLCCYPIDSPCNLDSDCCTLICNPDTMMCSDIRP
jgi:hypothetical protein